MSQASCTAVRTIQGRVWHRIARRDDLLTRTRCSSSFFTSRCEITVLASVPTNKRCARCWGVYTVLDADGPDESSVGPRKSGPPQRDGRASSREIPTAVCRPFRDDAR